MNQLATQKLGSQVAMTSGDNGFSVTPQTLSDIVEFAKFMCQSNAGIPAYLRGNAPDCAAITMQALKWNFDPFSVAQKSYKVKDVLAYEAQLIAAVVNTRSGIKGRLKYSYEGEGSSLTCTVTGILDGEEYAYTSPPVGSITTKNSPLWKTDPQQQLGYYSARSWARRHTPEVLLGVYDRDEAEEFRGPDNAKNITPAFDPFADEPLSARGDAVGAFSAPVGTVGQKSAKAAPEFDYAELDTAAPPRGGDDEKPRSSSQTVDEDNPDSSTVENSPADPAIGSREAEGSGSGAGKEPEPSDTDKDKLWLFNVGSMLWAATFANGDPQVLKTQRSVANDAYPATDVSKLYLEKASSVFKNCMSVVEGNIEPADAQKIVAGIIGCEEKDMLARAKGGAA